jgi:hypothetical protein
MPLSTRAVLPDPTRRRWTCPRRCTHPSRSRPNSNCWYEDPTYNATFAGACDRTECTCDAIENLAMGYQPHAMCRHHGNSSSASRGAALGQLARRWTARQPAWLSRPTPPPNELPTKVPTKASGTASGTAQAAEHAKEQPAYWACAAAAYDLCFETVALPAGPDTPACEACMETHAPSLLARGLNCSAYVGNGAAAPKTGVCAPSQQACAAGVGYKCGAAPALSNETGACTACAFAEANVEALANAGCNASWANQVGSGV